MAIKYKWLTEQLRDLIQEYIQNGRNRLPAEQELCARYRVSRQTVRAALAVLKESQEIRRIKGSGSYITGLSDQESRNVIGVLIPDEQQYQYPAFVNNLRTALAAYGYTCKVFPTYGHQDQERQILQFLLKNPLRAILAEPVKSALPTLNTELYQMLLQKGTAVFFLGCAYPGLSQVPVLSGNPDYGASLLVQDLAAKGHTCIAGIFQMDDLRGHQHCQGFLNAMENQGLLVPDRNLGWFTTEDLDDFRQNRDIRFLQKFLEKLTADCTAIVWEDDFIAWLLWEKLSLSSSAPFMETQPSGSISQLALSAFNTSYLTASGLLRAATLTSPTHEPAQMAARMIADKLKGLPVSSQEVPLQLLPPK